MIRLILLLSGLFPVFFISNLPAQTTIYVWQNSPAATPNGSSWQMAFPYLQDALAQAQSGDQIWVATGTYKPTDGTERSASFVLKSGVQVYGGFAGNETQLSDRNPTQNPTILSGEIGAAGGADNCWHVVYGKGLSDNTVLDGFTIRGGYADISGNNHMQGFGGGMLLLGDPATPNSSPRIVNCIFTANYARNGAGLAIHWEDADANDGQTMVNPRLENCHFERNRALTNGGGLAKFGPMTPGDTLHIKGCDFLRNRAIQGGGGGMYFEALTDAQVKVSDGLMERDTALEGGVMQYIASEGSVAGFLFEACNLFQNFSQGYAGLSITSNLETDVKLDILVNKCNFVSNKSNSGNTCLGFLLGKKASVNISVQATEFRNNTEIIGFYTGEMSSCIFNFSNDKFINTGESLMYYVIPSHSILANDFYNCLFIKTRHVIGIGVEPDCEHLTTFTNCTFAEINNTTESIFGKRAYDAPDHLHNRLLIRNCIIQQNDPTASITLNGNTSDRYCGFKIERSILNRYQPFSDPSCYGVPYNPPGNLWSTNVDFIDPANDNYRLDSCSVGIGFGNNDFVTAAGITTDLDGQPRIRFSNVDAGAYERADSCGISVGVKDLSGNNNRLDVQPNPVGETLHLVGLDPGTSGLLQVFNSAGVLELSQAGISATTKIDTGALKPGVYYVIFRSDSGQLRTGRFVRM